MGTRVPTINVFSKHKKNIKIIHQKVNIFTAVKYCCILHWHVCVMNFLNGNSENVGPVVEQAFQKIIFKLN